ncbi:MAG: SDR family NAD(P)-dependent oxidoreductase [Rhizobiales bacterium]|nr:SDR family NAD(P)-dependent oxidoreductase [Hyphomicrobiales bacterium]
MERVALISGASRGIGAAIAERLSREGWQLSLGMRNPQRPLWADPERVHLAGYDAHAPREEEWVEGARKRFGRIDAVIASAGIVSKNTVIEADDAEMDDLFAINVKAPRRLIKAAWDDLAASGKGRVVVLGSLSGKRVKSRTSGLYSISKYASVALAQAVRHAGFDLGIRATAVCPGLVATDMGLSVTDRPAELLTDPRDIARIVAMLIDLPNEASVAEFTINCQLEESY